MLAGIGLRRSETATARPASRRASAARRARWSSRKRHWLGAVARLGALRAAAAIHPWRLITGDVPVTVSVGATAGRHPRGATAGRHPRLAADLLRIADRNLSRAKHAGRNRICAVADTPVAADRR